MFPRFLVAFLAFSAVLPCPFAAEANDAKIDKNKPGRAGPGDFSYEDDHMGPAHCGGIQPAYAACSAGAKQSPINVLVNYSSTEDAALSQLDLH